MSRGESFRYVVERLGDQLGFVFVGCEGDFLAILSRTAH
jgi:hypothetical protein